MTSDGHEQLDLAKRQDQTGKTCVCGEEEGGGQNFHFHQNDLHSIVVVAGGKAGVVVSRVRDHGFIQIALLLRSQLEFYFLLGHSAGCTESLLVAKSLEGIQILLWRFLFLWVGRVHLSIPHPSFGALNSNER